MAFIDCQIDLTFSERGLACWFLANKLLSIFTGSGGILVLLNIQVFDVRATSRNNLCKL